MAISQIFRALAAGTTALSFALAALPVRAAQQDSAPGTQLTAVLETTDISSKSAQVGDGFTMRVVSPFPNEDPNFAGARLRGHVADVQSAGQGRPARLVLRLDSIVFPDGTSERVSGTVSTAAEKKDNTTTRQALGAGAGAAVGSQTIGRVLGGTLGSVVGLVGGAVAGLAFARNNKPNVNLARGTVATVTTWSDIEVPRRQGNEPAPNGQPQYAPQPNPQGAPANPPAGNPPPQ
jgi:hypothetical protein